MQAVASAIDRQKQVVAEARQEQEPGWKKRIAEGAAVGIASTAACEAIKALFTGVAAL